MARLSILDLGRLECDLGWQLAMPHPSTIDKINPPNERVVLPVLGVLIESRERIVLFDTGCHPEAMRGRWTKEWSQFFAFSSSEDGLLQHQIKLAGYDVADVTDVVLSHLHMDHSGNVGLFRHSKIWISRQEIEFALAESLLTENYVGPYVHEDWLLSGMDWRFVYGPAAVTPDISIFPLLGHTPGTLSLQVTTDNGVFIFPSDAIYMGKSIGPPPCAPGVIYDSAEFRKSVDHITYLRDHLDATVIFPHDPEQFETLKTAPHWYE